MELGNSCKDVFPNSSNFPEPLNKENYKAIYLLMSQGYNLFTSSSIKKSFVIIATYQYRMWSCKLTLQVHAKIEE